jgi:phosphatidylethanolamine/phosphatidyl-N-methylethanolamine N-methyltransferase
MATEFNMETIQRAYERWAPIYDLVFGNLFEPGRKATIAVAEGIGGRVLDVGIGTGISLIDYPSSIRVFGIDYSEAMLRKAHERVRRHNLAHVEALAVMDAQHLSSRSCLRFSRSSGVSFF